MPIRVVVTGVAGSVGSRVAALLVAESDVEVVGVDRVSRPINGLAEFYEGDLRTLDLEPVFEGADVLVHVASAYGRNEFVDASSHDTRAARQVLNAAERAGIDQCVLLSSAMVYGAQADNPIPITEHAPIAPSELAFAASKATIERLGREWESASGAKLVILRPSTAVAPSGSSWVARSLQLAAALSSDSNPPLQFLHLDDLAAAVVLTVTKQLTGIFNVAPDGWVRADEVRTLSGRAPRLRIPGWAADEIVRFSWERGIVATPPGIMAYATLPWVVANDRLRKRGWEPSYSNVEAYVDGYAARPWAMINAKQRQQLSFAAAAIGFAALGALGRFARNRWR